MGFLRRSSRSRKKGQQNNAPKQKLPVHFQSFSDVKQIFQQFFGNQDDIVFREFNIQSMKQIKCMLVFISDITNPDFISEHIIHALKQVKMNQSDSEQGKGRGNNKERKKNIVEQLKEAVLISGQVSISSDFTKLFDDLLSGKAILFIEKEDKALSIAVPEWESRGVEEPTSQTVVRGPREGFTENLNTNKALVRKRIRSNKLRFESLKVGDFTKTNVSIVFIEDIAHQDIVNEVKQRIKKIHIDVCVKFFSTWF